MGRIAATFAASLFVGACGLSTQGTGTDLGGAAGSTNDASVSGSNAMGSVSGADAGSVAPSDAGVNGDGGDSGCPVACNGQCHPKGTVCCTSESNCPNGNQVCAANGCVACGSPGTEGLACHAVGDCVQAVKMCFD